MAAMEAAKESQWISAFLKEIGHPLTQITLFGDNRGANTHQGDGDSHHNVIP